VRNIKPDGKGNYQIVIHNAPKDKRLVKKRHKQMGCGISCLARMELELVQEDKLQTKKRRRI
jgi:hypothetical protein